MIQINRGKEAAELAEVRDTGLKGLRKIRKSRQLKSTDFKGYNVVKELLRKRQKYKCCYCEQKQVSKNRDVEHFRPKTLADRGPHPSGKGTGYWWLAWSWSNLLFSCDTCNRYYKKDQFPLDHSSDVLNAEEDPATTEFSKKETPLLIDPATENGVKHIQFRPVPHGKWQPFPRNGSEQGRWTIKVCGLDNPKLLDLYEDFVELHVTPRIHEVQRAIQTQQISEVWEQAVELLDPAMEFSALSYDVLDHHFPKATRNQFGLDLPVPTPRS